MPDDNSQTCAHDGCNCSVTAAEDYCSPDCASGAGCDHPGCNCGHAGRTDHKQAAVAERREAKAVPEDPDPTVRKAMDD